MIEAEQYYNLDKTLAVLSQRVLSLEALLIAEGKSTALALQVQAKEYERRLSELNHAHTLAEARNAEYVQRLVYDNDHREADARLNRLEQQIVEAKGRATGIGIALGALFTIIEIILHYAQIRK
jgi:hypothetical protein